jgi:hypothetical protein
LLNQARQQQEQRARGTSEEQHFHLTEFSNVKQQEVLY